MQIYQFNRQGERPVRLEEVSERPSEGFVWLDFTRQNARDWPQWALQLAGVRILEEHVIDSFNGDHPSYFEGTHDYDMLIFQGLTPEDCENCEQLIVTKSAAFFIFDRLLISIRSSENASFEIVKRKFCETRLRFPSTPFGFVHVVIDTMVERYLTVIDELEHRLESLSDALLDERNTFTDWQQLLRYRKQAHGMEMLCEKNIDTIDAWRRDMGADLSESQRIRLNDVREHIGRVMNHADALQRDIEVAVQLHFSAVSHKTNKIVQTLTVLSAIFFPLTLLTGIWGMNFENMPELHSRHGYYVALGIIFSIGGSLLYYFRKRGYI